MRKIIFGSGASQSDYLGIRVDHEKNIFWVSKQFQCYFMNSDAVFLKVDGEDWLAGKSFVHSSIPHFLLAVDLFSVSVYFPVC